MAIGVDVELKVKTSKKQLEDQVKEKLKEGVSIDAQLVVTPDSIAKLSESIQNQLNNKQFTVNIGNVKLLASAKDMMKKQIEDMFGYSTKESTIETKELEKQVDLLQKKNAAQEEARKKAEETARQQREATKHAQDQAIALKNQKDVLQETYNLTKKAVGSTDDDGMKERLRTYKELMNVLSAQKTVLPDSVVQNLVGEMNELSDAARSYNETKKEQARLERETNAAMEESRKTVEDRETLLKKQSETYNRLMVAMAKLQNSEISTMEEAKPLTEQYERLKTAFEQAMLSGVEFSNEATQGLIDQADALVKDTNALMSVSSAQMKHNTLLNQAYNLYSKISSLLNGNARTAQSEFGSVLQSMGGDLRSRINSGDVSSEYISRVKTQLAGITDQMNTLGMLGRESDSIFNQLFSRFSAVALITTAFYKLRSVMSDMVEHTKELDAAMTELKKVTEETEVGYNKFFNTAGERAKELGVTIADIVNATADFARLGYNLADASTLADVATIYKNVGDGIKDIDDAAESIISTMKAFGVEASDAIGIVDRFNEIGRISCRAA